MKKLLLFIITFLLIIPHNVYSKSFDEKMNVLIHSGIISDDSKLDEGINKSEFAKIIVLASEKRNNAINDNIMSICSDVSMQTPNFNYIKVALDNGYMNCSVDGNFYPYKNITYVDLVTACLKLLSYDNNDFISNKVDSKIVKFQELYLDENIEKTVFDEITKRDVINCIYNLLKTKIKKTNTFYFMNKFPEIKFDLDNELTIDKKIDLEIKGPYIICKDNYEYELSKYDMDTKVYINSKRYDIVKLKSDIYDYGYAIYSYDKNNNTIIAYTENAEVDSSTTLKKGYITRLQYDLDNMLMPRIIMIDDNFTYYLEDNDNNFLLSTAGKLKDGDFIVFIYNKLNDVINSNYNDKGKRVTGSDDAIKINGSIVIAFKIS